MRILYLALFLCGFLFIACGDDNNGGSDYARAISIAANPIPVADTEDQVKPGGFVLPQTGVQDCVIPAKQGTYVNGKCEWKVEKNGEGWFLTYTEQWNCADYNAIQGSTDFCAGETGTHEWSYDVAPDGRAGLLVENGDSPPEALQ